MMIRHGQRLALPVLSQPAQVPQPARVSQPAQVPRPELSAESGPVSGAVSTTGSAVAAVDSMSLATGGALDIGVAVLDRQTGQLNLGAEGATPFYSASVVKLFTVVDIVHRAETGQATLSPTQLDNMQRALSVSDDNAMNALWDQFGGSSTVTEMIGLANLQDTQPPGNPGEWGETRVSARDVVAVYQYLLSSINPGDAQWVLNALSNAQNTGADGFDQAFGLLASPRLSGVEAKQGWMVDGGSEYLHSSGIVGSGNRYLVAVLSKRPASNGYDVGRADVSTAVGRLTGSLGLTS